MRFSRLATLWTWVSTTMAGLPREKSSTHPAVLGPTPGSSRSQVLASGRGISLKKERSQEPFRAQMALSISWSLGAFIRASPPVRMDSARRSTSASSTSSQVGKVSLSVAKAR